MKGTTNPLNLQIWSCRKEQEAVLRELSKKAVCGAVCSFRLKQSRQREHPCLISQTLARAGETCRNIE